MGTLTSICVLSILLIVDLPKGCSLGTPPVQGSPFSPAGFVPGMCKNAIIIDPDDAESFFLASQCGMQSQCMSVLYTYASQKGPGEVNLKVYNLGSTICAAVIPVQELIVTTYTFTHTDTSGPPALVLKDDYTVDLPEATCSIPHLTADGDRVTMNCSTDSYLTALRCTFESRVNNVVDTSPGIVTQHPADFSDNGQDYCMIRCEITQSLNQMVAGTHEFRLTMTTDEMKYEEVVIESDWMPFTKLVECLPGTYKQLSATRRFGRVQCDAQQEMCITLEIPEGQLVAVVGQVGCGKSSLVSAILGEMDKLRGHVTVKSSIAYVPQQAWIQNGTFRDNVLFGKPFDQGTYTKVVEVCALGPDLQSLPAGDLTEIGEKGINLSGGQKQRLSLARAVYNDADIYLMDDPLSAVDSQVGKHIFDHVISHNGCLNRKWLPEVDTIVVISEGRVSEKGSYDQLISSDGEFARFLRLHLTARPGNEEEEDSETFKSGMEDDGRVTVDNAKSGDETTRQSHPQNPKLNVSTQAGLPYRAQTEDDNEGRNPKAGEILVEKETLETGKVKLSAVLSYLNAVGLVATSIFLVFSALFQSALLYSNIWLSEWTGDALLRNTSLSHTSGYIDRNCMYLGVYGGLGLLQGVMTLCGTLIIYNRMANATGVLHNTMLTNIMHNPMSFFDTTPSGRILNRFSRDIDVVDNLLPELFPNCVYLGLAMLGTIVVVAYSTPLSTTVTIPLACIYLLIQRFFVPASRQLKRLESAVRSPIYAHFSETIAGAVSIRAYGVCDRFVRETQAMVDRNLAVYFAYTASERWLGIRLKLVGNLVVMATALFLVESESVSESLVGLAISEALNINIVFIWLALFTSDLETNIISVERISEYSETRREAAWVNPGNRPDPSWPEEGVVRFHDYETRYRPNLDLVLKGISCTITGGEKIGIVGRTGAGKSSMMLALFRLIEPAAGWIDIDGVKINDIGLHDLRSKITILPQDPVLFSGSLRMNLDPINEYDDSAVWRALDHAHLMEFVRGAEGELGYECGEGGQNMSVGQRQLVCMARSLLRNTKILVLDEATAAVDMETDDLIQRTIRTEFSDCTVLTIAHRLNTVMDYDRIMVLDQGEIVEMDSPTALIDDKTSAFYSMAKEANLV